MSKTSPANTLATSKCLPREYLESLRAHTKNARAIRTKFMAKTTMHITAPSALGKSEPLHAALPKTDSSPGSSKARQMHLGAVQR
jgi:hypothetical protein